MCKIVVLYMKYFLECLQHYSCQSRSHQCELIVIDVMTSRTCVVWHSAVEAGLTAVRRRLIHQLQRPTHLLHVKWKAWNNKIHFDYHTITYMKRSYLYNEVKPIRWSLTYLMRPYLYDEIIPRYMMKSYLYDEIIAK